MLQTVFFNGFNVINVCVCVPDLSGDQRGEQHQSGAAEEIQERDEPEEEMSQRAGPTQRFVFGKQSVDLLVWPISLLFNQRRRGL